MELKDIGVHAHGTDFAHEIAAVEQRVAELKEQLARAEDRWAAHSAAKHVGRLAQSRLEGEHVAQLRLYLENNERVLRGLRILDELDKPVREQERKEKAKQDAALKARKAADLKRMRELLADMEKRVPVEGRDKRLLEFYDLRSRYPQQDTDELAKKLNVLLHPKNGDEHGKLEAAA